MDTQGEGMSDPNWRGGVLHEEDDLGACRGILCGVVLGALVWAAAFLIWWWL